MSTTLSIGKVCAITSTALLMGAYVWHQSRNGETAVAADTTIGQAVAPTLVPGSQPEALSGPKSAPVLLPGSKEALVFDPSQLKVNVLPGSKSDSIYTLPGSKWGKVVPPDQIPDGQKSAPESPPAKSQPKRPRVFSSSKSKAPLISPPVKKQEPVKPRILPGSKTLAPLLRTPEPKPNPTPEPNPALKSKPKVPPRSKTPSSLIEIDPAKLKERLADNEARLSKEREARDLLKQQQKQSNGPARPE